MAESGNQFLWRIDSKQLARSIAHITTVWASRIKNERMVFMVLSPIQLASTQRHRPRRAAEFSVDLTVDLTMDSRRRENAGGVRIE